jgi:hypothetical protein
VFFDPDADEPAELSAGFWEDAWQGIAGDTDDPLLIVVGEFADQPEYYLGRTFSRAKYAAARFRMSFSTSSCLLRRSSSASSFFSPLVSWPGFSPSSASAGAPSSAGTNR